MIELEKSATVSFWCNHIDQYKKDADKWYKRAAKIVKRYKDERPDGQNNSSKFNILWSNVQTLAPALYDKNPIPNIDRRFQSDDELGTVSAQVLERCVSFFTEADEFGDIIRQSVLDRLLAGRGTAWVRYVPNFRDVTIEGSEDVQEEGSQETDDAEIDVEQELTSEDVVVDFVHYEDFGHCFAKTWQEVRAVWRAVPMSRKELIERFGDEIGSKVPMDAGKKDDDTPDDYKRSTVYEIWDKQSGKVYWINKSYPDVLDERDDPLKLSGFFPCPKPIYATLANDKLIPTPDYVQYQDQAKELDDLTGRISNIITALRVAGVYDASAPALSKLLDGTEDNILIPVDQWAIFGEKGGLKGVIDFLPIKEVGEVLIGLYQARDRTKQELYEITGISDIIRGASNPNETLGAQELKGKYAGLRMGAMQGDVARFCRDIVRIFAEIIAEHFSEDTIKKLSGFKLMTAEEKAMTQQQAQMAQQPLPDEMQEMMQKPTWEEVIALLKDDTARGFRITIETDSTIKQDQDAEKAARTEFLTAAGGFINQASQVPNPELAPLLMEMLKFGVKGFKIGREMETTFDVALDKLKKQAEQPPTPQADHNAVEKEKVQAELQMKQSDAQAKIQIETQKAQTDSQLKQMEIQSKEAIELKRLEQDAILEREKMAIDAQLRKYEIDLKNSPQTTVIANLGE